MSADFRFHLIAQAFVNVLDVAKAHISALTNPVAAGKRYLLVAGPLTYDDIVSKVSKLYPEQAGR